MELFGGLFSPDLSAGYVERVARLCVESLLIGMVGNALALALAFALVFGSVALPRLPADGPEGLGVRLLRAACRGLLAFQRAVPDLVWALLFVRIVGLGPGAAVLAIGLSFAGIIGKLFAETMESVDPEPARRLRAQGASLGATFLYGVWPLVKARWTAYSLFRLECSIRTASILGVVGAGGLGQELDLCIRYFEYDKLATNILAIVAYLGVLEVVSATLRRLRARWFFVYVGMGAAIGLLTMEIPWADLFSTSAIEQARSFLAGFLHPTLDPAFLSGLVGDIVETVAMAFTGTALAALAAFLIVPAAIRSLSRGASGGELMAAKGTPASLIFLLVRLVLHLMRALPELLWAMFFVLVFGPGAQAGAMALAVHSIGVLSRLFSDAAEEASPGPIAVMQAEGASSLATYLHAIVPQVRAQMLAFTLFRFEVNLRAAAVIGFVGAGGLGDALHTAVSLFHMSDLATLILATLALVIVVEALGRRIRLAL
jgi:phosphonate transport system permease protein